MNVYAVLHGDNVCFWSFHRYKIASFLIPNANLLNDDNPLANKQWIKLVNDIDNLEIGQGLEFGEYVVVLEEIDEKDHFELMKGVE